MNPYNPHIHHRKSIRLKGYDYSQEGLYFITICCHGMVCRFGSISGKTMVLNRYGQIAHDEGVKTCEIRPNVELGAFVVMPNHVHGIVRICRVELHSVDGRGELHLVDGRGELHLVDGRGELHSPRRGVCKTPLRGPSQTVGAIVRGYKSTVTKQLGLMGFVGKLWLRNYWEHIIRDETSYIRISAYIVNNPAKWADDKFCKK